MKPFDEWRVEIIDRGPLSPFDIVINSFDFVGSLTIHQDYKQIKEDLIDILWEIEDD